MEVEMVIMVLIAYHLIHVHMFEFLSSSMHTQSHIQIDGE